MNGPSQPEPGWSIVIFNGQANGGERISSAKILINGVSILPKSFNAATYRIEKDISDIVAPLNDIYLELRGKPGGHLTILVGSNAVGNICLLARKNANGEDVTLDWQGGPPCSGSGGGPLYSAVRSVDPTFSRSDVLIIENTPLQIVDDQKALLSPTLYYYKITDGSVSDPDPCNANYCGCNPLITSLTPNIGFDGDSVTIAGSCFNPVANKNFVDFNGERAVVTAASPTGDWLTVTVPVGVTTGPVSLQSDGILSNDDVIFMVEVPTAPTVTFQDISSMFYHEASAQLYVADRGTNDRIYRINFSTTPPTVTPLAGLNQALMSHGRDSADNLFYVSSAESCFNQGRFRSLAADDTTVTNPWRTIGTSTDAIWTKALAVKKTDLNQIYVSVARQGCSGSNNHTVRRVKQFGPGDNQYGNRNFDFPMGPTDLVSGSDFDSNGVLFVSNGTELWRIDSDSSTTLVASGFIALAGLDVDDDSGLPFVLAADRGSGKLWLINGNNGERELVVSGLSSPRAVATGVDLVAEKLYWYVAEANRILRYPDPKIKLHKELRHPGKVMISTLTTNPSEYDMPQLQFANREIKIDFEVKPHPAAPIPVYMLVVDPPAAVNYGTPGFGDNRDPSLPGGNLQPNPVTVGTDGKPSIQVTFQVTDRYAGDNYKILFSFVPFPSPKVMAETKVLTAWKRVYVEVDTMYKKGSSLNVDFNGPGNQVTVDNGYDFAAGGGDKVLLFDAADQIGQQATTLSRTGGTPAVVTLDTTLTGTYTKVDGAGLVIRDAGLFDDEAHLFHQWKDALGEDAFVECVRSGSGEDKVPHRFFPTPGLDLAAFRDAWFDNRNTGTPPAANYVWICLADHEKYLADQPGGNTNPTQNYTYIYQGRIAELSNGDPLVAATLREDTVVHELIHQYSVNDPSGDGHCQNAALEGSDQCIMDDRSPPTGRDRTDGDTDLDIIGIGGGFLPDVYGVRDEIDPI